MAISTVWTTPLPVFSAKKDTDAWFIVKLVDDTDDKTGETGVGAASVDADIRVDGSDTFSSYSVSASEWQDMGEGFYAIKLGASEFDTAQKYIVRVGDTTPNARKFAFVVDVQANRLDDIGGTDGTVKLRDGVTHGGSTTVLTLQSIGVTNSAGSAVTLTSSGTNGNGLRCVGNGTGAGLHAVGGATGVGFKLLGGATSGAGLSAEGQAGNSAGIQLNSVGTGPGLSITALGTASAVYMLGSSSSAPAVDIQSGVSTGGAVRLDSNGSGAALELLSTAGYALSASGLSGSLVTATGTNKNAITFTPTGTGLALGAANITSIETDTADIQSRLPAALSAGGMIKSDLQEIKGSATTATVDGTTNRLQVDCYAVSASTTAADNVQANIGNLDAAITTRSAPATAQTIDLTTAVSGAGAGTVGKALENSLDYVDTALSTLSTLTQTQVTGGAYALDTDANGRIRIVDGTAAGELDTTSGLVNINMAQAYTEGSQTARTVGGMLVVTEAWMRNKIADTGVGGTHKLYQSDGTTVLVSRDHTLAGTYVPS